MVSTLDSGYERSHMRVYGDEQSQTVTLLRLSGLNTGLKCKIFQKTFRELKSFFKYHFVCIIQ